MKSIHPSVDLAPRDIVARELQRLKDLGHSTFLDCRKFSNEQLETMFPSAYNFLKKANIDFTKEKIPVTPAAHYHMGGVFVDENGKSSIKGLWACGEVSSTGAHGANRLASNSLLEAFVFGKRIATSINSEVLNNIEDKNINFQKYLPKEKTSSRIRAKKYIWQLRNIMSDLVGVYRNEQKLRKAFIEIDRIEREAKDLSAKLKDMILVSRLITYSAYLRKESRGAHFRSDYPKSNEKFLFRKQITLKEMEEFLNKKEYIEKVA
jgi:L-aspartate oxidase